MTAAEDEMIRTVAQAQKALRAVAATFQATKIIVNGIPQWQRQRKP